jgi:hypothetical protein
VSSIEVLALGNVVSQLERRIERLEKTMKREFHGQSGYTKGCRCSICRKARAEYMRKRRAQGEEQK